MKVACLIALICSCCLQLCGETLKTTLFIYSGPGVGAESLQHTLSTFKEMPKGYQVELITPQQVIEDNWEERAALFVLPGGADIPYVKSLKGKGNKKIRDFVENGGCFLGICAGAYYAGNFVDFAKGTELEVQGSRELAFFPGTVRGPLLASYDYKNNSGARAKLIRWNEDHEDIAVYFNGGGYFLGASQMENIKVLASYELGPEYPAIIECTCGKGVAILSGVHFEFDPKLLDKNDPYLQDIIPVLEESNEKRLLLIECILQKLSLSTALI